MRLRLLAGSILSLSIALAFVAGCEDDAASGAGAVGGSDASFVFDAPPPPPARDAGDGIDAANAADAADAADAAKTLPEGLIGPIPYLARADNPLNGITFASYTHFENWETGTLTVPGVTPGAGYAVVSGGNTLTDSVDGDDGALDGTCAKAGGCGSAFGGGTLDFTFDAAVLGGLPTHVGIAWTDGATGCDASFEAYDALNVLIGTRTATGVGDATNTGSTAEDRYFGVVHAAGVKRIVVKSSAGGVEVDHLLYGR